MTRILYFTIAVCAMLGIVACEGVDRRGEVPYKPTVQTVAPSVEGNTAMFEGIVTASPNSSLTACGFNYGNDTLDLAVSVEATKWHFFAEVDSLAPGRYYSVAYATNGMGTSRGDTLWFEIK